MRPNVVPAAALAALASLAAGVTARAQTTAVPVDVRVAVALVERVTSSDPVGETFAFTTTRDVTLGGLRVPAGTPGHGRLAVATPAHGDGRGSLALQADSIDLPDGRTVAVDVDPSRPVRGHYANRRTRYRITPLIPLGIVPQVKTTVSGDLILDAGTPFAVVTTLPRATPAPLLTATPGAAPAASPHASPTP